MRQSQTCDRSDDIVAAFLDGEPTRFEHEDLAEHLDFCQTCSVDLEQARRLDAMLATHTNVSVNPTCGDQWLKSAMTQLADAQPTPARWRRALLAAVAVVLFTVAGIGLGFWLGQQVPQPKPMVQSDQAVSSAEPQLHPQIVALPGWTGQRLFRNKTQSRTPLGAILTNEMLAVQIAPTVLLRNLLTPTGNAQLLVDLQRSVIAARVEAGRKILAGNSPTERHALRTLLTKRHDGPLLATLLPMAADNRQLVSEVGDDLRPGRTQTIRLASRLGGAHLDRRLLRLARQDARSIDDIVEALGSVRDRPGRITLLCDLWKINHRAKSPANEPAMLQKWFGTQPASATTALIAETKASRNRERRHLCIAAMGQRRDINAVKFLLELVQGTSHQEAIAAGHALTQLRPRQEVLHGLHAIQRQARRPFIVLAARASHRDEQLLPAIQQLNLTTAEQRFLRGGSFHREQFAVACHLFRSRTRQSSRF